MLSARFVAAIFAVLVVAASAFAQASEALSIEEFTTRVAKRLVFKRPDVLVKVEPPSTISVTVPDGLEYRIFTDNTYQLYVDEDRDVAQSIDTLVSFAIENFTRSETIDTSRVYPVIKTWSWLHEMIEGLEVPSGEPWKWGVYSQGLFDELALAFVEDSAAGLKYLTTNDVVESFGTPAEAKRIAFANLRRLLPELSIESEQNILRVRVDETYDTSILLLDEVWLDERLRVAGDIVLALPARGELLVGGSRDSKAIAALRRAAETIGREHPYRLSTHLFVRRDGRWALFEE
ncbi:MAG: hypothetical protein U1E49_16830 [Hyphomicrobiaceae bacterium]|mgnify:CR=1 FL=1